MDKPQADLPNTAGPETTIRLLRMPAVQELTGFSRTEIYKQMKDGTFPKPLKIGIRSIAWTDTAIEEWIKGLEKEAAK